MVIYYSTSPATDPMEPDTDSSCVYYGDSSVILYYARQCCFVFRSNMLLVFEAA